MAPEAHALRQQIIDAACTLAGKGLSPGLSGNVSARSGDKLLITPTASHYEALTTADIVEVGLDGAIAEGQRKPSNETPFHQAIYNTYPDAHAVIHTHSPKASALACLMANHGQIVLGPTLSAAVSLTGEIENLSGMYLDILAAGEPQLLSDAEMDEVLALFADYRPA